MQLRYLIGIDVGGTFTDIVGYDRRQDRILTEKVPTTPENQALGVLRAIEKVGLDPRQIEIVVHGTTVGINAIVQRKADSVGLICTKGFRDILEVRRTRRAKLYDMQWDKPPNLIPRDRIAGVEERIDSQGNTVVPLDEGSVKRAVALLREKGVESYAVCLMFGFLYPQHERRIAEIIEQTHPGGFVSLASSVAPEIREYERTSTTVMNAIVHPVMHRYLNDLLRRLGESGCEASLQIMKSNGGMMSAESAVGRPLETIQSGPAAGVISCTALGASMGRPHLIGFDMGGTTTDVSLVVDGKPIATLEEEVEWSIPIRMPMVFIQSIGAGGGSIAWVDRGGALNVGPQSAGAQPGPVCYGQGGIEPTVTDANLVLGRIDPEYFLGGEMPIDVEAAREAVARRVGEPFGWDAVTAADAVFQISLANMAQVVREITVHKGRDPRDFSLVTFGGAGGLYAGRIAEELGIGEVIVPYDAAVFSALGCLRADVVYDYSRPFISPIRGISLDRLNEAFRSMREQAERDFTRFEAAGGVTYHCFMDMRYVGETFELPIEFHPRGSVGPPDLEEVVAGFHAEHRTVYGFDRPRAPVELMVARLRARQPSRRLREQQARPDRGPVGPRKERRVYFDGAGVFLPTPIFERDDLPEGVELGGPCIIEEPFSTTVVFPGQHVTVDALNNIILRMRASEP